MQRICVKNTQTPIDYLGICGIIKLYDYAPTTILEEVIMEKGTTEDLIKAEPVLFRNARQKLEELQKSEEYQKNCQRFQTECNRLATIAQSLLEQKDLLQESCDTNTVRREFASQSRYLHRGFYCPSPVLDKIIGNAKRGRILKRITSASKPTHEYGFDASGRLLWCTAFDRGSVLSIEYLIYDGHAVYGITFNSYGIEAITEEVYEDGKLVRYIHCLCTAVDNAVDCRHLECEHYSYEEDHLCGCEWHRFSIPQKEIPDFLKEFASMLPRHPIYQKDSFSF